MFHVSFVTIVPSPYQRDLFAALAARPELELQVFYLEAASPDSPWPQKELRPFERILPGFWAPFGGARWHFNWRLPDFSRADFVVLSSFTSWTGQWLMRHGLRGRRWLFWGERLRRQESRWKAWLHEKLMRPMNNASGIVGIGKQAEADYRVRFPAVRHFCVPYYCDLSPFLDHASRRRSAELVEKDWPRNAEGRATSPPLPGERTGVRGNSIPLTFLFCGQMIARKGVDLLLAAFNELVAGGADARLLLVGREAELPAFMKILAAEARSRVRYEGFQPPEKLPEYFAQADVFVLPSRHDGWGVVVNQALGAGLPLLCSDAVGAAHDLIEPEVNGLIFPAGNLAELLACLRRLAGSPETAIRWGNA